MKLEMFRSARVKLTLFYLAILLAFSLTLTVSFRVLFERDYSRSNMVQRGEVRQLILRSLEGDYYGDPIPSNDFMDVQRDQAAIVRQHLNDDLLFINALALVVGGILSYWFAGRTLDPIEKAHEAQARFATDASHELRTPLTNLKLENEVFLRQKSFTEKDARELIVSNLEEVQRLEGLSASLLALTQYGHATLKLKQVNVARLVDTALKHAEKIAEAQQVACVNKVVSTNILGHAESLEQLLSILIDNAVKYGPVKGTVTIGGQKEDGHYLLWVQDEGPGIDPKDLPYIFDRLYRGDKARSSKVGGYGLGLSLAQAIAKANGAELRAQNAPHAGACFLLRLPLARPKKP